jgi:sialate O-acetylesterase
VKPHALFSDHVVLQQGKRLPVWGTTDTGEPVTVSFAGQELTAEPKDGRWRLELAPLAQNTVPAEMTIRQGSDTFAVKDVLVGEVWVCGGQSNMEWTVVNSDGANETLATSTNDQIRLLSVPHGGAPHPESDLKARWQRAEPETVRYFSAVAYYFGRKLQRDRQTPVGLISSNVGGTPVERWTPAPAIEADPELKSLAVGDLYNHMIAPLAPGGIRGFLWYQGEANRTRPKQYRKLLPAMIRSWREAFDAQDAPFLVVQIAPFMKIAAEPQESKLAELRDAQLWVTQSTPRCGLVVTTDVGDPNDIHPRQKAPVGERLELCARALAYGESIEYSGPIFERLSISGPQAILSFTHLGDGLMMKGETLTGFTIAGEDRKFFNAKASIEGNTVVVTSDEVPKPVAVRYGWADCPVVNLWNKQDLPASPFRTDDFPLPGP